jgi:hypothetical protein
VSEISALFPSFLSTGQFEPQLHFFALDVGFGKDGPLYDTEEGRSGFRAKFNQVLGENDTSQAGVAYIKL